MKEIVRFSQPRRSPWFGLPLARATVGLLLFGALGVLGLGCAAFDATRDAADAADSGKSVVRTQGLQPDWNLDAMVRRSDAVVVGTVEEVLGSNRYPGPSAGDDEPRYDREYRNYKLTIQTAYHPASLSGAIAVMTGPYPVQSNPNILVDDHSNIPDFAVNDRVLVFLDSLDDSVYSEGPGETAPDGYTKARYYRTITGSHYGKLTENGVQWSDTRSNKSVSANQVREAVTLQKGGGGS